MKWDMRKLNEEVKMKNCKLSMEVLKAFFGKLPDESMSLF